MIKHRAKQGERIYLIKVILSDWYGHIRGMPYRILAIPDGFTLYSLAEVIVGSFDFAFDHPFGFYDNIKRWTEAEEGYEIFADMGKGSEFKGVERTKVNEVFDKIKKRMLFLFDYGDEWHFIVELKGMESPNEEAKYPFVVESVGEAPPQYGEMDE